jgi:hypothetical protein
VSKERDIRRFGLPVRVDNEFQLPSQKACSFPLPRCDELARGIPTSQERDSGELAEPSPKKLDPPVLWFICRQGCQHTVFGMIFQDLDIFKRSHRHWCCDWCSIHSDEHNPKKHTTAGPISVGRSILNANPPSKLIATKTDIPAAEVRPEKIILPRIGLI